MKRLYSIEISLYDDDIVNPTTLFEALEQWLFERFPEFSGVIGMSSEEEKEGE